MREGYRGYVFARPFLGERAPQHVQNLVIRDYAARNGLSYKLSATEYAMDGCHMMLEQVLDELPTLKGLICYSLFQLPVDASARAHIYARVRDSGAELHAALEDLAVREAADIGRVEDIWRVRLALAACPRGRDVARAACDNDGIVMLRPVGADDCDRIWAWRNHPTTRPMFRHTEEIALDDHRRWFEVNAVPERNAIYIALFAGEPIGYVRFALAAGERPDISFIVAPDYRGGGFGTAMLRAACARFFDEHPGVDSVATSVAKDNPRSFRAFRSCGFTEIADESRFRYTLARRLVS